VNLVPRLTGWRRALTIILGAQLLFWCAYALIVIGLQPAGTLEAYRLPVAQALLSSEPGKVGAYAAELSGPAVLHVPGWQPVVLYPARASLLSRGVATAGNAWSLTCPESPCPEAATAYAGPFDRMSQAAGRERFQRFDMVWLVFATELMMGSALLVLLPVNRFSRLQSVTGLLLILVGIDAWLTTFGAENLPYDWFPLLRYATEYLMLTAAALAVNAFAGWRPREARVAGACFAVVFAVLTGTMILRGDLAAIIPWLDAAALTLLLGYGFLALLRMARTAPGPAIRVLALLLVGLTSIGFDLFILPPPSGFALQASVLAPPLTMLGILLEIALQGHRLNQEAEEARSDLERQVLEQDASLLRSSQLLRHQERLIAIDAERQRLLRDMHDGVGGVLTHLLLDVRENRLTSREIEQGLQFAVDDLRNMASAIDAGNEPIDEALAMFRERMAGRLARSGITLDYRCMLPVPAPSLDVRRLLSLYRLLQEGIANSVRHASATRIELAVKPGDDGAILVLLSDDGIGFEPEGASGAAGEGRGLANMRRRAVQMGGRIGIESAPGRGTQLILAIPTTGAAGRKA
jgi:signal transduction histidine kinase